MKRPSLQAQMARPKLSASTKQTQVAANSTMPSQSWLRTMPRTVVGASRCGIVGRQKMLNGDVTAKDEQIEIEGLTVSSGERKRLQEKMPARVV